MHLHNVVNAQCAFMPPDILFSYFFFGHPCCIQNWKARIKSSFFTYLSDSGCSCSSIYRCGCPKTVAMGLYMPKGSIVLYTPW